MTDLLLITRKISDEAMTLIEENGIAYKLNEADVAWSPQELAVQMRDVSAMICLLPGRSRPT